MGLPKHISHSQLEVGLCPHRYDEIYIKKNYAKATGLAVQLGGFEHQIVNKYVKECVTKKIDGDIEILERIFAEVWKGYKLPEIYYKELHEEMLGFGEKNINYDNVLDTEKEFNIEFDKGKLIKGYIDITRTYLFRGIPKKHNDPILHIIDYKRQANILSREETLTDQFRIYTLACTLLYPGYKWYRRGIYYTKYNFMRFYEDEDNPTSISDIEIEVEETRKMLIREWRKLRESKEYPCKQGDWCYKYNGCPILLADKCPVQNKDKDIKDWIRTIWQLNIKVKQLKARVKSYITGSGNVIVDEKEVGYIRGTDSITYKLVPVIDICRDANITLIDDFTFGKTDMGKVLKEVEKKINFEDITKELDKFKEVEEVTKFSTDGKSVKYIVEAKKRGK